MGSNTVKIQKWEKPYERGAKRANLRESEWLPDWFVGFGKDESCCFEGSWWDMICFARNVLASPNTKQCAPEWYHPEYANDNYCGEEQPYEYVGGGLNMQNDLISRSALKSFFCKCCNILHLEESCEPGECNAMEVLNEQPAVDAVEIVRCKDCKWLYDGKDMYCCTTHTGLALIKRDGSSFCSYGERRADDGRCSAAD